MTGHAVEGQARWLVLWRHGEAEPAAGHGDRARRLTLLGQQQARTAARHIAALVPAPDLILHSDAPRAAETAAIGAAILGLPAAALQPLDELYLATPGVVLQALARHAPQARCVLVVGHNPGLSELGAQLDARHEGAALDTAGFWRIARED